MRIIDIDWTVANTVVVGVRVERVSSSVGWTVVNARVGFIDVIKTVTVIVQILNQSRVAVRRRIERVWIAVAVCIGVASRVKREGIRASNAVRWRGHRSVAHAVAVCIRVERIGADFRFICVGKSVVIVIGIFHKARCIWVGWIIIARKFVWHSVAVAVFQDFNREVPRNRIAVGVVRPHGVGRVGGGFGRCSGDFTSGRVEGQRSRQVRCNLVGSATH